MSCQVFHSILIKAIIAPKEGKHDDDDDDAEEDDLIQQVTPTTSSLDIILKNGKDDVIDEIVFISIGDAVSSEKALAKLSFVPRPDTSYHLYYKYLNGYDQPLVLTDFQEAFELRAQGMISFQLACLNGQKRCCLFLS